MILAFIISAWIAFVLVAFGFLFVDDAIHPDGLNRLDRDIIAMARRLQAVLTKGLGASSCLRSGQGVMEQTQTYGKDSDAEPEGRPESDSASEQIAQPQCTGSHPPQDEPTENGPADGQDAEGHSAEHAGAAHAEEHKQFVVTRDALQAILLVFSDQQLVTGLAIISVAFGKRVTMTEYHFFLAVTLAWLSLTVHGCTTAVIGRYMAENFAMKI